MFFICVLILLIFPDCRIYLFSSLAARVFNKLTRYSLEIARWQAGPAICQGQFFNDGVWPRRSCWQSAEYGRPRHCTVPGVSFSATPTQARAVIANYGISKDACAHIREQPSGLLQQPALRRQWRAATEVTGHSECSRAGGDGSQEVRSHHSSSARTPLVARPPTDQV